MIDKKYYKVEIKECDYKDFNDQDKVGGNFITDNDLQSIKEDIEMYLFFRQFGKPYKDGFVITKCDNQLLISYCDNINTPIQLPTFRNHNEASIVISAWEEYKKNGNINNFEDMVNYIREVNHQEYERRRED